MSPEVAIAKSSLIGAGSADVKVDWKPSSPASREGGVAPGNIAQPFKRSGRMLSCRKGNGIKDPADFA